MSNRQAHDQSRNRTKSGLRVHANVEVRHCEVGRSGSLIIFYPEGKSPLRGYIPTGLVHYVDWSAMRIHPNGIGPLRGLVRKADIITFFL